jgi:hypothetical protein
MLTFFSIGSIKYFCAELCQMKCGTRANDSCSGLLATVLAAVANSQGNCTSRVTTDGHRGTAADQ